MLLIGNWVSGTMSRMSRESRIVKTRISMETVEISLSVECRSPIPF